MTMLAMVPPFTQGDWKMNALARVISFKKLKNGRWTSVKEWGYFYCD